MKEKLDNWIFEGFRVRPEALALSRIFYAGYLLFFAIRRTDWVADFPQLFYRPPLSIARFFSDFPHPAFFHVVNVLTVVLLVMLLFGYRTKLASIGFTVLVLVYSSFAHSLGKIDHMILFTVTPLVLSFSNWGAAWSIDAKMKRTPREVHAWPLALMAVLIGFTLATSGWWKAGSSWLDLSSQAIQSKLVHNFFARDRVDLLAPAFLNLNVAWIWEFLDWAIVLFEILFLFVLISPRLFRLWVYFGVAFHFGVLLILNIDFSIHLTVFLPFFPWEVARKALGKAGDQFVKAMNWGTARLSPWLLIPIAGALFAVLWFHGNLFMAIQQLTGWEAPYFAGLLFLGGGFLIWTMTMVMAGKYLIKQKGKAL